jgi:hypothetical protein
MENAQDEQGMKRASQKNPLAKRIVSAILGRDGITPAQQAKIAEMEKDYEELMRNRNAQKDGHKKS